MRRILWGMPMPEDFERAERKGLILGGCCVDDRNSMCECGATAYDIDGNPVGAGVIERLDVVYREGSAGLDPGLGSMQAGTVDENW